MGFAVDLGKPEFTDKGCIESGFFLENTLDTPFKAFSVVTPAGIA